MNISTRYIFPGYLYVDGRHCIDYFEEKYFKLNLTDNNICTFVGQIL